MSNFALYSDLIEVDYFGYYDKSKESDTGYPQERPGWILTEDVFFIVRISFGLERAPDLPYFCFFSLDSCNDFFCL